MAIVDYNEKEPIVFLPAMMCDGRVFGPQIKMFGASHAIHLAPLGGHERVEDIARAVLASAPTTFALVGLSMGAAVAMEIMRQAPNRVTRLALVAASAAAETPQQAASREPEIVRVMAGLLPDVIRDRMKPEYLFETPLRQTLLDLFVDMALDLGEGVFLRQSRAMQRRPDHQNILRKLRCPTLVLSGQYDVVYPVERHEVMADLIPGAELRVIADAGLLPTLENPQAVNGALRNWLARAT